jgi:hypothetical protein
VLCISQDHLRFGTRDLDHHVLASVENTDSWYARKGDLQSGFSLYVLMVPSSGITVTVDGERLTCGGFSLGETICFGSLEFIADFFGGLCLSLGREGSDATVIGATHNGPPSPLRAMIWDSAEEFHTTSDGEGGYDLPSRIRHGAGASPAPTATISWPENTPTAQAMVMIPPW